MPLNGSLSNLPWTSGEGASKRGELRKYSQYLVNKNAIDQLDWGETQIRERGEAMAQAILRIWPKPTSDHVDS
jgi:hypothetical protein